MPMLIEHIDAIARAKQRDVLYVVFEAESSRSEKTAEDEEEVSFTENSIEWGKLPVRQQIIDWLECSGIAWQPCGNFASPNVLQSYQGQIYIDLPYDTSLPEYAKLAAFMENPDGTMRLPNAIFCYLPIARAMDNAHHDQPGFWEKWAETF